MTAPTQVRVAVALWLVEATLLGLLSIGIAVVGLIHGYLVNAIIGALVLIAVAALAALALRVRRADDRARSTSAILSAGIVLVVTAIGVLTGAVVLIALSLLGVAAAVLVYSRAASPYFAIAPRK